MTCATDQSPAMARTVSMATLTTFAIGGPVTLITVDDLEQLAVLHERPHRWLGGGANLLVADAGLPEPVLTLGQRYAGCHWQARDDGTLRVRVGAALPLPRLLQRCLRRGAAGLEDLAAIPGSVGGALWMNAGPPGRGLTERVRRLRWWCPQQRRACWSWPEELPVAYRGAGLSPGAVILAAEFDLAPCPLDDLRQRFIAAKQRKADCQPLASASAGCVFRNPTPEQSAGRLLDEIGTKGWRCGDAVVSSRHANFIINVGSATAADVCTLLDRLRQHAWRERRVRLEPEIEFWGCSLSDDVMQDTP